MKNKAVVMTGIQKLEIQEYSMPVCGDDEVLVKTAYVGICGSDAHFFETGEIGTSIVHPPFVLGHEYSGTIIEIGKNVKHLSVGDRVTLEPGVPCGQCSYCKSGRYNLCDDMKFKSSPPVDGLFMQYVSHPAHLAFKLPETVSLLDGALIEPLAVGFYASETGDVALGKTVAILGSGCIGLTTLLACRQHQASRIIVTDMCQSRLEKAKELGATDTIDASREDVIARIAELTDGRGADVVFETAGSRYTALQTSHVVAKGGRVVMVGAIVGDIPYNFRALNRKEADLKTIWRYCNVYPKAVEAVERQLINLDGIISDIFDFRNAQEAFEKSIQDKEHTIKIALKFGE